MNHRKNKERLKKEITKQTKKTACERLNFEIICNKWSTYFKEQVYKYFLWKKSFVIKMTQLQKPCCLIQ